MKELRRFRTGIELPNGISCVLPHQHRVLRHRDDILRILVPNLRPK
jgi:hypothetical protein